MPANTRNSPDGQAISSLRAEFIKMRDEMKKEMEDLKTKFETAIAKKDEDIERLSSENKELRACADRLEEKLDDSDAYERKDCIVFSGDDVPSAGLGENCKEVVLQLVKEKLKINLQPSDVSTAHRLGRKPVSQGADRRKLIMKLCRRDMKRDIIHACKELKPGFYANESLTPTRNSILFALRQMKRIGNNSPVKGTATVDGNVYAWIRPVGATRDQRVLVNTLPKLREFSINIMKKPLTEFLPEMSNL